MGRNPTLLHPMGVFGNRHGATEKAETRARQKTMNRKSRIILALIVAIIGLGTKAEAHHDLQNAMWVQFEPASVRVALNVSLKELTVAQGVKIAEDGSTDADALELASDRHFEYLLRHLTVSAGGKPLAGKFVNLTPPLIVGDVEKTAFMYEIEYPLNGPQPAAVSFFHDMLKEWPYSVGTSWEVSYSMRVKRSDSNDISAWLLPARKATTIPTGWASPAQKADGWRTFGEYLHHGVMHILTGYDHLLFVAALVIATASFWEMVKVIAAFTLAHTLTLGLSVFNLVRLSSSIVEPIIALSIVVVALENVIRRRQGLTRMRLAVAFGFGLVHGLGFAGGLLDAMSGLPSVGIWVALIAFSIGVEIGHQAVVLPLFGLLAVGRVKMGDTFRNGMLRYGSAVVAFCGAYYLVVALRA